MSSGKKYKIVFNTLVWSDLRNIDKYTADRIEVVMDSRLSKAPDLYGLPLRTPLKGFRKLRIGDYRVVYFIHSNTVIVEAIGHRKNIYPTILKRLGL